ncbi:response regulator transcription factor [Streptomyces cellostaticus]|uniref:response regulator transcription factor n=1 Tax=Streptomyces TaxID=1883 RepID=UPI00202761FF|nr:response regulator transcription factor [Streptomyces cellostaticus]
MRADNGLVLIVEDDRSIASLQELYLARDGFGTHVETDGLRGLDAVERLRPVAIVLDVALPGLNGVTFCRRLRERDDWTPVLMVTARGDESDRILGLQLGADDYITKPFSPGELVARIHTVLRRTQGPPGGRTHVVGVLRVDAARRTVHRAGDEVELTATEFNLLEYLLERRGRVFSRRQLLAQVWGDDSYRDPRVVDVYVSQLRSKLGDASPIRTVRGVGYGATDTAG